MFHSPTFELGRSKRSAGERHHNVTRSSLGLPPNCKNAVKKKNLETREDRLSISEFSTVCDLIQSENLKNGSLLTTSKQMNKPHVKAKTHKEITQLIKEMKHILSQNEELQKKLEKLLEQEKKWKKELFIVLHSQEDYLDILSKNDKLNGKISKLELETKQEVQQLCQEILSIKAERNRFQEQINVLLLENESLKKKCNQMTEERTSVIPIQTYVKEIENHQINLKELVGKYEKDLKILHEKCDSSFLENEQQQFHSAFLTQVHNLGHLEEKVWTVKEQMKTDVENMSTKTQRLKETALFASLSYEVQIKELKQKITELIITINNLNDDKKKLKNELENLQKAILLNESFSNERNGISLQETDS